MMSLSTQFLTRLAGVVALSGAMLFPGTRALAQTTVEWANLPNGSNALDIGSNWANGNLPTSTEIATFSSATFAQNPLQLQSADVSIAGIRLSAGAGALTFSSPGTGGAKKLSIGASGIVNSSSNTLTFDVTSKVNVALTANASFTADGRIVIFDDSAHSSTNGLTIGSFVLTLNGSSTNASIDRAFTGTGGSVIKSGTGTWTLSGANSYDGSTTLSGGTLSVSSLASGGTVSNIGKSSDAAANLVFDGGTLQYTGAAVSTLRLFTLTANGGAIDASGTGALSFGGTGNIVFSGTDTSPTLTLGGTNTGTNTFAAMLGNNGTGATSLTKSGGGSWVLTAANTLSGTVTVTDGTLTVNSGASLGSSAVALTVNGGTLNLNNSAQAVAALSGTGGVINFGSGHTLTINQAATTSFAGTLTGPGSLVKTGSGTLVLSGANTYTNGTIISGGKLLVANLTGSGTGTNTVTVDSGATFGGSGSISGSLVLNPGAIVSPGAKPGTLGVGPTTFSGGAEFAFEISNPAGVAGTNWDLLSISGALTITADSNSPFVLDLTSLNSDNNSGLLAGFDPANTYSWQFVHTTGGITGFSTGAFQYNASQFQNSLGGGHFFVSQTGSDLYLNFTPVPEPATYALLGLGGMLLLLSRRRRN